MSYSPILLGLIYRNELFIDTLKNIYSNHYSNIKFKQSDPDFNYHLNTIKQFIINPLKSKYQNSNYPILLTNKQFYDNYKINGECILSPSLNEEKTITVFSLKLSKYFNILPGTLNMTSIFNDIEFNYDINGIKNAVISINRNKYSIPININNIFEEFKGKNPIISIYMLIGNFIVKE